MKRILITGANKGIGLATVRAILTQHDDALVLLGSRDPQRGQQAIQALLGDNAAWAERLQLLPIDVCDADSVAAARKRLSQDYGANNTLYGLVNNAGIGLGSADMSAVIEVNTLGVKRVCEAFLPLLQDGGRLVNVSSASAPNFVAQCSNTRQAFFQDASVEWAAIQQLINEVIEQADKPARMAELGLGQINAYGFSKACTSLYTLLLARDNPRLLVNACTPGYIETDLTRPMAKSRGKAPAELGMKPPEFGTVSILHLLFGKLHGSGHYYGSDGKRSPMDRYRAPGDAEYMGD